MELHTLNQSPSVDNRARGPLFFKEHPFTMAPPNTFSSLKQSIKPEAPMPHHGATKKEKVKNQVRVYLLEYFERY